MVGAWRTGVLMLCVCAVLSDTGEQSSIAVQGGGPARAVLSTPTVLERWRNMESKFRNVTSIILDKFLPRVLPILDQFDISPECDKSIRSLLQRIRNLETRAFSFLDSSAKTVEGAMSGLLSAVGNYDQCLDIGAPSSGRPTLDQNRFKGKYCVVNARPVMPAKPYFYKVDDVYPGLEKLASKDTVVGEAIRNLMLFYHFHFHVGLCVPSSCSTQDITNIAALVAKELHLNLTVPQCTEARSPQVTATAKVVISLFIFIVCLTIAATLMDSMKPNMKYSSNTLIEALLAFSLWIYMKKLKKPADSSNQVCCLNGIRFLSMSWIILAHTYVPLNANVIRDWHVVRNFIKDPLFQVVINSSVAVDSFFFLSGLLLCYSIVDHVRVKQKKFNWIKNLIHRYFRLTPGQLTILGAVFLLPLMRSGPFWVSTVDPVVDHCSRRWWANVLYINNFIKPTQLCLNHTWYLATEFQLHVISLVLIVILARWPKVGLTLIVTVGVACMVACGVITYILRLPPTQILVNGNFERLEELFSNIYFQPYAHMGSYGIGIVLGYFLATREKLVISPVYQALGWSVAVALNLSVLYGVLDWNSGTSPTVLQSVVYASLHRTAWALGVCWLALVCLADCGGVIQRILSWHVWTPLARLSFLAYLIHPLLQLTFIGHYATPMTITHQAVVWMLFGHLVATYGMACIAYLLIESPFLALEKMVLSSNKKSDSREDKITVRQEKQTYSWKRRIISNCVASNLKPNIQELVYKSRVTK